MICSGNGIRLLSTRFQALTLSPNTLQKALSYEGYSSMMPPEVKRAPSIQVVMGTGEKRFVLFRYGNIDVLIPNTLYILKLH